MATALHIATAVILGIVVIVPVVWHAISTIREAHTAPRPLIRRDVETILREHGWYVVHAESHVDLQLTLF